MVRKGIHIVYLAMLVLLASTAKAGVVELQFKDSTGGEVLGGIIYSLDGKVFTAFEGARAEVELFHAVSHVVVEAYGFERKKLVLRQEDVQPVIWLKPAIKDLHQVTVIGVGVDAVRRLPNLNGTILTACKKSEKIKPSPLVTNVQTNQARQLFRSTPGLNVWENEAGGLQLNVGARGLDPGRTGHFNTRQNGYDISADPLGYPETYYVPPFIAIESVEVIRGAASLQYGPQFGGMINFKLKTREKEKMKVTSHLSGGSFGYLQSYTGVGGTIGDYQYYTSYQYRHSSGFRPSSHYDQHHVYGSIGRKLGSKTDLRIEYTGMRYLAKQAGGLQDFEYEQNPYQTKRYRNWFKVNWNLASANLTHRFSKSSQVRTTAYGLIATRSSLGDLSPINRPDPMRERDLIQGTYRNWGWETRFSKQYGRTNRKHTLVAGKRLFVGHTHNKQGFGSPDSSANFHFTNPDRPGISDYNFPSLNAAMFAENEFRLTEKLTVTPGVRLEHIRTLANGYFEYRLMAGDQIIFTDTMLESRQQIRSFPLFGLGASYRLNHGRELYANVTQNYRAINFTDMVISNPNLAVDPHLQDESGYNFDLGFRGYLFKRKLWVDASVFYLRYNNRIGLTERVESENGYRRLVTYRTNIGNAYSAGMESYLEGDLLRILELPASHWRANVFVNASITRGEYVSGGSDVEGNQLEFVLPFAGRGGVNLRYRSAFFSWQSSWQSAQFTDATNAVKVNDATRGVVPAFALHDVNVGWRFNKGYVKLAVNNLFNSAYFTRRALTYPGPGIIPGEPRSIFLSVGWDVWTVK